VIRLILKQNQKGFSLIELLVVIAIIGLLASVVGVSITNSRNDAKDAKRRADIKQLIAAIELYNTTNGSYPSTNNGWWGETSGFGSHGRTGANGYIPNLAPNYVPELPHDPDTGASNPPGYCSNNRAPTYLYRSDGVNYKILAHCIMEEISANDPLLDPIRDGNTQVPPGCTYDPNTPNQTRPWAIGGWSSGAICW
jgi:type II secretion system protein G